MILTHGANSIERGGGDFVEIGGRKYPVVKIGNQLWMAENLDYKFSGCEIGTSGTPASPAAWYYNNDEVSFGIDGTYKCGLIYNGDAAEYLNNHLSELGVPSGWRVSTFSDWQSLATEVGGASTAGTKLKAANVSWAPSWGGTDDYGFGVLPAGSYGGTFYDLALYGDFWTSTEASGGELDYIVFDRYAAMRNGTSPKKYALSIRLVKDAP